MEEKLSQLQPDFENLMEEANQLLKDLKSDKDDEKKAPILNASRKMSGVHVDLAIRRQSLRDADYKYYQMKDDLDRIQIWLADAEKALRNNDEDKLKV